MKRLEIEMMNRKTISIELLVPEIVKRVSELPVQKTSSLRNIRKDISRRIKNVSATDVLKLAFVLIEKKQFIYRWFAYELIGYHSEAFKTLDRKQLEKLGNGIDSWYSVDSFACYLSGPAWRKRQIADADIHRWAKSKDRWWRRAALVSTVPLNNTARGGTGDTKRTLAVCEKLLDDRDDMVVKAQSWALRELSKKDPANVQKFIDRYKNKIASRVLREVGNKLKTGLKNPKR